MAHIVSDDENSCCCPVISFEKNEYDMNMNKIKIALTAILTEDGEDTPNKDEIEQLVVSDDKLRNDDNHEYAIIDKIFDVSEKEFICKQREIHLEYFDGDDTTEDDDSSCLDDLTENDDFENDKLDAGGHLDYAILQLQNEQLQGENKFLKNLIQQNECEAEVLKEQLIRETKSKNNLVAADRKRAQLLQTEKSPVDKHKMESLIQKEYTAQIEAELMNELVKLTNVIDDKQRKHSNEMLEKDFEIAKLHEEIRKLKEDRSAWKDEIV